MRALAFRGNERLASLISFSYEKKEPTRPSALLAELIPRKIRWVPAVPIRGSKRLRVPAKQVCGIAHRPNEPGRQFNNSR